MSKRKYSSIWLHFEDVDGQKAKCKQCKTLLSFSGGSHGNLSRHLKSKHPLTQINVERQAPPEATITLKESENDTPSTSAQALRSQQHQIT